jgi:D-beta-D-heptose 7-phosphate kinase/D-beta-D-heptose 1-phosphate adenosyltransferase
MAKPVSSATPKIFGTVEELLKEIRISRQDKKIVFTNGCFDIVHPGHIQVLTEAAQYGDILVIGLNSDESVKRLKGDARPVVSQDARAEVMSALAVVDYVVLFNEDTPYRVIQELKPDVLVKGGEYGKGEIVGEDIAKETIRINMKPGFSTSDIIKKIKNIKE